MSGKTTVVWQVVNRDTGIVVSSWASQFDALEDKNRRDDKWSETEPLNESRLEVRGQPE